jgi:chemotaxis protein MotB
MADEGGGAPGWIMTFADLMSLLLAFFVLLFSFSNVDDQKYNKVGGSMKEAFGVQRRIDLNDQVKGISFIAMEYSSAPPDPTRLNVVPQENLDIDKQYDVEERQETGGEPGLKGKGDSGKQHQEFPDAKTGEEKKAADVLEYVKDQLADEILKGELNVELDGEHVVINISEDSTFEKGSVDLKEPFKEIMGKIGDALGDVDGEVQVAGHTDNEPITSDRFRSNWELSAGRAVTVLHGLLEYTSIKKDNFVVMGYGDTKPRTDNTTADGRAKNRRVEVKLRYDAIRVRHKDEEEITEKDGFEKSMEDLGRSLPSGIGPNNESVFDIIMEGYR